MAEALVAEQLAEADLKFKQVRCRLAPNSVHVARVLFYN